jgi:hypothetical protein
VYDRDLFVGVITSADLEKYCPEWQHVQDHVAIDAIALYAEICAVWAAQDAGIKLKEIVSEKRVLTARVA